MLGGEAVTIYTDGNDLGGVSLGMRSVDQRSQQGSRAGSEYDYPRDRVAKLTLSGIVGCGLSAEAVSALLLRTGR
ncbi:hypothetical protein ACETU7_13035 [Rhodococcus sp. 3Y1]